MKAPVSACSMCGKKTESDCSRAECGNRKTLTADVPARAGNVRLGVMMAEDYFREFNAREKDWS
jgi:hypothetical protein